MNRELRNHIIKLAAAGTRLDGRKLDEYRQPLSVETNCIKTAEGSARVILGKSELLVGVKVEVMTPYPDQPDSGSIMVGAELLPMSSPDFESGPPSIEAIELARVIDRGIRESKAVDFKSLSIESGEKAWMLIVDIVTVNHDGNLFDASAIGVLAALKSMKFPKYEDGNIMYGEPSDRGLDIQGDPVSVTVCKIGDNMFIDPGLEEEAVTDARLTVATLADGTLCAMQKGGDEPLDVADVNAMVALATEKTAELRKAL